MFGGRSTPHSTTPRRQITAAAVLSTLTVASVLIGIRPADAAAGMDMLCNRADYGCVDGTGYRGQSHWGANFGKVGHNCTSYVSYRLAKAGAQQPWFTMGNANQWNDKGKGKVPIDDEPTVGSVAQWEGGSRLAPGDRGHVGYVEAVTKDGIEVTDDTSSGGTRRYRISRGSPYWPDNFIHIFDEPTSTPALGDAIFDLASSDAITALKTGRTGVEFAFGQAGETPVVGNWDGAKGAGVGTFDSGRWTLTNSIQGQTPTSFTVEFGERLDIPVVGDWDGDGIDTVGVFHDGTWLLANSNDHRPDVAHRVEFGQPGDTPVAGDWNGDGVDTIGVYRAGTWLLSNGLRATPLPPMQLTFGAEGDLPVVGNWDGIRGDTIGTFNAGTWRLINLNTSTPDGIVELRLGGPGDLPVPGTWEGKRTKLGVAR